MKTCTFMILSIGCFFLAMVGSCFINLLFQKLIPFAQRFIDKYIPVFDILAPITIAIVAVVYIQIEVPKKVAITKCSESTKTVYQCLAEKVIGG